MLIHKEYEYKWYETIAVNIIKKGNVPRHIAAILDGNRRFARKHKRHDQFGMFKSFEKMSEFWKWCIDIGIKEVTIFAFPLDDFKVRPFEEIDTYMGIFKVFFREALVDKEKLKKEGVKIRVIGKTSMLSEDLQEVIAKVTLATENNDKVILNLAMAYSSREEMANAIHDIIEESGDDLKPEDINEDLVSQCLYTKGFRELDLLIRTSGNPKVSDFLMWQLSGTVLQFPTLFWPELTLLDFVSLIFSYQRVSPSMTDLKQLQVDHHIEFLPDRARDFLQRVDARRRAHLVDLANANVKEI